MSQKLTITRYCGFLSKDEDAKDKKGKVEVRSRPKALIELGYYLGRFGQKRVVVLCTHEIHDARPSDIDGVFVSLFRDSVSECTDFVLTQLGALVSDQKHQSLNEG